MRLDDFREIWCVDFEFFAPSGERPYPICLVARELRSGRTIRLGGDALHQCDRPPYPTDASSLFVAYYASAEIGCHLALGWPVPARVLDLYVEFRNHTNERLLPCGSGLLGALVWFGLDGISVAEKEDMRQLAQRGSPWTREEHEALLIYCESDVSALIRLLPRIAPHLDLSRALLRGRYMVAAARMEHVGLPIDAPALAQLRAQWTAIQDALIAGIDVDYGVYEGRTFKVDRFARWLAAQGIPWPRLPSGALSLDDEKTFRPMARIYPAVAPLRELRYALGQMRLHEVAVGADERNRCILSAFRAKTGRNQPSNAQFIFGPAVWLRGVVRPEPGYGLVYLDWEQQEFGIAAALSGDLKMIQAYTSGDPYLALAQQVGAAPPGATKATHGTVRELFKACVLGVQYGMQEITLGHRIGRPPVYARELLRVYREAYPRFWRWSDAALDYAMLYGRLNTVFGWTIHVGPNANPRSLRNFPMQANGAEILRLACCLATERGVRICAPVHDALLIEAPLEALEDAIYTTQQAMAEASAIVLSGFRLRSEAKVIRYPERYMDPRGERMWTTVWDLIEAHLQQSVGDEVISCLK